jgi:glycerophosphoryl diester phosphodiesterase
VAFHDDDLRRTCDLPGRISKLPWQQVSRARVRGEAPIPLLEDILGSWPDLRVNIDCKSDGAVRALISVLKRHDALDRVCVGAFSDRRMITLRAALGGGLCTALGPRGVASLRFGRPRKLPAMTAQVPVTRGRLTVTDQRFVERAHALGIHVHVWTIDEPEEMERLLDLGVDGIMTDRPAVLRDVLERREHWRA